MSMHIEIDQSNMTFNALLRRDWYVLDKRLCSSCVIPETFERGQVVFMSYKELSALPEPRLYTVGQDTLRLQ